MRRFLKNMPRSGVRVARILAVVLLLLALSAACGGGGEEDNTSGAEGAGGSVPAASDREIVPTMPAARFDQPTPVTDMQEAREADNEADKEEDESEPDLSSGEFVYGNRCAECHGAGATGTEDGAALVGLTLSEDEFEDLLRTGGALGPEHLFGSTKISPDGLNALYAYLASLP